MGASQNTYDLTTGEAAGRVESIAVTTLRTERSYRVHLAAIAMFADRQDLAKPYMADVAEIDAALAKLGA